MAIPPEPLAVVLPLASAVVIAEVVAVENNADGVVLGPDAPPSSPRAIHSQRVKLKVSRVLRGGPVTEVEVLKPIGDYALRVGNHGAFLLDGRTPPVILGRYGPDTYRVADLEAQLAKG